jgi:hypothetical protein
MLARKGRVAVDLARSGGMTTSGGLELNQLRVRDMNQDAITRYRPAALKARARVFITEQLGDAAHPRLEWLASIEPKPEVVLVPGSDSGDAMSTNVASLTAALRAWLDEVDLAKR